MSTEDTMSNELAPGVTTAPDPNADPPPIPAPPAGSNLPSFEFKKYQEATDKAVAAAALGELVGDEPVPIATGGWNDTRNDVENSGKYMLLAVPEWKPGMSSYLRLGAACSTWDTSLGNELEKILHLTGPVGKTLDLPFIDDERSRGGASVHPGVGATVAESEILHTKGGWRDHSDGNRITTTYGDKIEVVRGSYKMVVLGRQDTPADSSGYDVSGQIIQDWGYSMPGASVTVEWLPIYGGTWLLRNSTEIFHGWGRFAGNKKEEYWGDLLESYIGQEHPGRAKNQEPSWPGGEPNPALKNNPIIKEKTFAKSITSQTGSPLYAIPAITDDKYVGASASSTWADAITATTTVNDAISSTTKAGSTASTTTVDGAVDDTTIVSGSVSESTTVGGAITAATTVGGAITEVTTALAVTNITTTGASSSLTTTGVSTDITLTPAQIAIFAGALDVSLYLAALKVEIAVAALAEIDVTAKATFTLIEELELNSTLKNEEKADKIQVSGITNVTAGTYTVASGVTNIRGLVVMLGF